MGHSRALETASLGDDRDHEVAEPGKVAQGLSSTAGFYLVNWQFSGSNLTIFE